MSSISQRLRERAALIPGVVAAVAMVVWLIELALRGQLNGGQVVWVLVSAGLTGVASLLVLLPLTLALDALAAQARRESRLLLYIASFGLLGLALALVAGAPHPVLALLGGSVAGALLAKMCAAGPSALSQRTSR